MEVNCGFAVAPNCRFIFARRHHTGAGSLDPVRRTIRRQRKSMTGRIAALVRSPPPIVPGPWSRTRNKPTFELGFQRKRAVPTREVPVEK